MALASEPAAGATQTWQGLSGRQYQAQSGGETRRGSKASVRPVVALGAGPKGAPAEGMTLALKLPWKGNPEAPDALDREARVFQRLCVGLDRPPCPRVVDLLGEANPQQPGSYRYTGVLMEWCPVHLEAWWAQRLNRADAFEHLCEALAELCEAVRAYQLALDRNPAEGIRPNARIKPRNVVQGPDGRWLISDFEEIKTRSVYDEHLSATQPLMGGENYQSPEALFNADRSLPMAMDTWSIGCVFYALLRMRPYVQSGAALPFDGTNSPHFRTHRMHLVTDLHARKPTLMEGRALDAGQFLYADRLPDQDRRAIVAAVEGIFGEVQDVLEGQLAKEILRLLDRALRIDPERRYGEPVEMARDLRVLASRYRELRSQLAVARARDLDGLDEATQIMPNSSATFSGVPLAEPAAEPRQPPPAESALPPKAAPAARPTGPGKARPFVPPEASRAPTAPAPPAEDPAAAERAAAERAAAERAAAERAAAERAATERAAAERAAAERAATERAAAERAATERAATERAATEHSERAATDRMATERALMERINQDRAALEARLERIERRQAEPPPSTASAPPPQRVPVWILIAIGGLAFVQFLTLVAIIGLALSLRG